jgi:uridine phosphorylase
MSNLYLPFNTYYRENPDYNSADSTNEFNQMVERQNQMIQVVDNELEAEALFETLESQGIDSGQYVDATCEYVDRLIRHGWPPI